MSGETQEQFALHMLLAEARNFYWLMMNDFIIMAHRQESDKAIAICEGDGNAPQELSGEPKRSL
jgi:hypothetical protein